ncbi:MAG: ribonuclease P protein component [Chloroflexota bacterium]
MQRRYRLHHTRDFQRLREEGQVKRHPTMICSYRPNSLSHNRYGFITAKHLGNAVKRNRTRRLMRESVRLLHPTTKQGYDVVFIARPPIVGQPFQQVQRIVNDLFRRAGLIVKEPDT